MLHNDCILKRHQDLIKTRFQPPHVITIAGVDSSGGAGITADIKSITAFGGYAMNVITAITSQNTQGVDDILETPLSHIHSQIAAITADVTVDAIKIGMLASAKIIETVRTELASIQAVKVLDPVMVATTGARLLADTAILELKQLIYEVDLITPNILELAILSDSDPATTFETAVMQSKHLAQIYGVNVLIKGGHLLESEAKDLIVTNNSTVSEAELLKNLVSTPRVDVSTTHGAGCSLSSALATVYCYTQDWNAALKIVKPWITDSIAAGAILGVGNRNGPLHHFHFVYP